MRVTKIEWDAIWEELGPDWYLEGDWDETVFESMHGSQANLDPYLYFEWQGEGDPRPNRLISGNGDCLKAVVTRWRKAQTHKFLIVRIPKARVDEFSLLLAQLKGVVVK